MKTKRIKHWFHTNLFKENIEFFMMHQEKYWFFPKTFFFLLTTSKINKVNKFKILSTDFFFLSFFNLKLNDTINLSSRQLAVHVVEDIFLQRWLLINWLTKILKLTLFIDLLDVDNDVVLYTTIYTGYCFVSIERLRKYR